MMPAVKLRRKSKIFWPKAKIIIIAILVIALVGVVILAISRFKTVDSHQNQLVLPAVTSLSFSDQRLAEIVTFLASHNLTPSDLKINGEVAEFNLDKTLIILPLSSNLNPKLTVLEKVWRQYELNNTRLQKIDLRYNYPLVSYQQQL